MKVLLLLVLVFASVFAVPQYYGGYDNYGSRGSEAHADSGSRRVEFDTPFGDFAVSEQYSDAEADSYSYNK